MAFSGAVAKCSARRVAPWHHGALSVHEGLREVLVGAREQRHRDGSTDRTPKRRERGRMGASRGDAMPHVSAFVV